MATNTRVVLDLNTRVKVIHASERDELSVKQIMKLFNIGKTQELIFIIRHYTLFFAIL
jgi:hypothetical protein